MIAVAGIGTTIAQELDKMIRAVYPDDVMIRLGDAEDRLDSVNRYLMAAGVLHNKALTEQSKDEMNESLWVNAMGPIGSCEKILAANPQARICIIGSKAGEAGSFDQTYAAAKAAVHNYVRNARITGGQQIVCIAPTIIEDSGMTSRRNEDGVIALDKRREEHPKKRFLKAREVAKLVHFLLYVDEGYITNTVIEMKGGPGWW